MTRDEFEARWCERAGITLEKAREMGFEATPCDCGCEECRGWRVAFDMRRQIESKIGEVG